ncbi:hypothetical protein NS277_09415 [Novosphingobium barchaimii]|nr:hypothetical protein NS277_09415 [Novosphingobium barchaimii]
MARREIGRSAAWEWQKKDILQGGSLPSLWSPATTMTALTDRDLSRRLLSLMEERRSALPPGAGNALTARVIAETGML